MEVEHCKYVYIKFTVMILVKAFMLVVVQTLLQCATLSTPDPLGLLWLSNQKG